MSAYEAHWAMALADVRDELQDAGMPPVLTDRITVRFQTAPDGEPTALGGHLADALLPLQDGLIAAVDHPDDVRSVGHAMAWAYRQARKR